MISWYRSASIPTRKRNWNFLDMLPSPPSCKLVQGFPGKVSAKHSVTTLHHLVLWLKEQRNVIFSVTYTSYVPFMRAQQFNFFLFL